MPPGREIRLGDSRRVNVKNIRETSQRGGRRYLRRRRLIFNAPTTRSSAPVYAMAQAHQLSAAELLRHALCRVR